MPDKLYSIKESTLVNLGDAIRSTSGDQKLCSPHEWPELIKKGSQLNLNNIADLWTEKYEVMLDNCTIIKVPEGMPQPELGYMYDKSYKLQATGAIWDAKNINSQYYKIYYAQGPSYSNDAYLILETEKNLDNFQVGEEITGKNIRYNRENIRISLQNFSDNEPV